MPDPCIVDAEICRVPTTTVWQVAARLANGSSINLFSYDPDKVSFIPEEFVGLTTKDASDLYAKKLLNQQNSALRIMILPSSDEPKDFRLVISPANLADWQASAKVEEIITCCWNNQDELADSNFESKILPSLLAAGFSIPNTFKGPSWD